MELKVNSDQNPCRYEQLGREKLFTEEETKRGWRRNFQPYLMLQILPQIFELTLAGKMQNVLCHLPSFPSAFLAAYSSVSTITTLVPPALNYSQLLFIHLFFPVPSRAPSQRQTRPISCANYLSPLYIISIPYEADDAAANLNVIFIRETWQNEDTPVFAT